jgi:hypothetical protein
MTLIFALGNREHTVLVIDRRYSSDAGPVPGDFNKSLVLNLPDARLAVAFTGLAGYDEPGKKPFKTRFWLAESLLDAPSPIDLWKPP